MSVILEGWLYSSIVVNKVEMTYVLKSFFNGLYFDILCVELSVEMCAQGLENKRMSYGDDYD